MNWFGVMNLMSAWPLFHPDNWNIETVPPDNGSWYNGELQYYTDREDNIKVEDGFLNITAKREDFSGKFIHFC